MKVVILAGGFGTRLSEETGIKPQVNMQDLLAQPELLALEESSIDHDVFELEMIKILDQAINFNKSIVLVIEVKDTSEVPGCVVSDPQFWLRSR